MLKPALLLCLLLIGIGSSSAWAEEFYKGKTLRFIVGQAPGGGYDTYVRTIARHIGKHIPGNPSTVVENMEGAGSLISANYVYKQASLKDPELLAEAKKSRLVITPVSGKKTEQLVDEILSISPE
ncbi:MAG: hypothetical protein ACM35E_16230, partial [Deltaproteobacteria bacterium]